MDPMQDSYGYQKLTHYPVDTDFDNELVNLYFEDVAQCACDRQGGAKLFKILLVKVEAGLSFSLTKAKIEKILKFCKNSSILSVLSISEIHFLITFSRPLVGGVMSYDSRSFDLGKIIGFFWSANSVLGPMATFKPLKVSKERVSVRHVRSYSVHCSWFVWSSECSLLLLCCGSSPTTAALQPFTFKPQHSNKLPKFEVEISSGSVAHAAGGVALGERDVCIGTLYGSTALCVLRHPSTPTVAAHLDVYQQNKDSVFKRTHICRLELTGRFAVNIVDSLIIVHHQASKTSLLFDIDLGGEVNGSVTSVFPVTIPLSIKPFTLTEPNDVPSSVILPISVPCELYAPTWVVFQARVLSEAILLLDNAWNQQLLLIRQPANAEDYCAEPQQLSCSNHSMQTTQMILQEVPRVFKAGHLGHFRAIF
ncbi:unnamed protein product, partial [Meganyctiphanes norvegica]